MSTVELSAAGSVKTCTGTSTTAGRPPSTVPVGKAPGHARHRCNVADFRLAFSVDWVDIDITLQRASQARHVGDFLAKNLAIAMRLAAPKSKRRHAVPRVVVWEQGARHHATTQFRLRIHDPANASVVMAVLDLIRERWGFSADPVPRGIEIALDARSSDASFDEYVALTTDFFRFNDAEVIGDFATGSDKCRVASGKDGKAHGVVTTSELERALANSCSALKGDQGDIKQHGSPVALRAYVKTHDQKADLPADRTSARIEFTLAGRAAPFQTLRDLLSLDFSALRQHFGFRRITDRPINATSLHAAEINATVGARRRRIRLRRDTAAGGYGTRVFSAATDADEELHRKVRDALKALSKRWCPRVAGAAHVSKLAPGRGAAVSDDHEDSRSHYGNAWASF